MSDDVQRPPLTGQPYEIEQLLSRLSHALRSHTNSIRLVDAKEVANAKLLGELLAISSSLRESSAAGADRLSGKLDTLIELARDSRADMRQALAELRGANDRLGTQRDAIADLKLADRYTPPYGVPLLPKGPEEESTRESPPDGITVRHGRIEARVGLAVIGKTIKRHGGWLTTGAIAGWHFLGDHLAAAARAAWHFLGH